MFEDIVRLAEETRENLTATSRGVKEAKRVYGELKKEIRLAKQRLSYKKSTRHAEVYVRKAAEAFKRSGVMKEVLRSEIDDALIRAGAEFQENSDFYKSVLYEIVDEDNTYLLSIIGSGWGARISPQILFEHAGTIIDYARGVTAYRSQLKTKVGAPGTNRGLRATSWWKTHVYGSPLYENTIRNRIELSGRKAPFWSLIAHGSTSLRSDRPDSSYNPLPSRGVNFIFNAEETLRKRFEELLSTERLNWQEETEGFQKEVQHAEQLLNRMDDDLEELKVEYQKNRATLQRFGEDAQYISENKLAEAARRFRAGEEFETDRIELTAPGSPRRIRRSVNVVRGLIEY